jgi:hypothetical protein
LKLLFDGWSMLFFYKEGMLVFFMTIFGLGYWGKEYFFKSNQQGSYYRNLTIFNIGSLLLTWASLFLMVLGRIGRPVFMISSILLPLASLTCLFLRPWRNRVTSLDRSTFLISFGIGFGFILYLMIRLAFLRDLILPPYDDSPDHFMIVREILNPADSPHSIFSLLSNIAKNYYHIGFHAIAAWLSVVSALDPAVSISLLGQIFIFMSSISIFYLTLVMTENIPAGFIAAVFTAFAWKMPAFAANWGKYPAIMGLTLLPGWLGLMVPPPGYIKNNLKSFVLRVLIILGLSLIHTRLIICLIIIAIAYRMSQRMAAFMLKRWFYIGIISTTLLMPILFFNPVQVYYSNNYYLAIGLVILLAPFACIKYPQVMTVISLSMMGVWLAYQIPVPLGLYGTPWLDAPFVETLLYIPFSLIAGLGYSGLLSRLKNYRVIRIPAVFLPVIILVSSIPAWNTFYPDPCCNYVRRDDLNAIRWVGENTPVDSVIWIAGFKPHKYVIGTDAGVWMHALAGRNVNKLPYDFDWNATSLSAKVCPDGYKDVYVFLGSMLFSFRESSLNANRQIEVVFGSGSTKIYRVNCEWL